MLSVLTSLYSITTLVEVVMLFFGCCPFPPLLQALQGLSPPCGQDSLHCLQASLSLLPGHIAPSCGSHTLLLPLSFSELPSSAVPPPPLLQKPGRNPTGWQCAAVPRKWQGRSFKLQTCLLRTSGVKPCISRWHLWQQQVGRCQPLSELLSQETELGNLGLQEGTRQELPAQPTQGIVP